MKFLGKGKLIDKIFFFLFAFLLFFHPLVHSPFVPGDFEVFGIRFPVPATYELFEFNKMIFVYLLSLSLLFVFCLKLIYKGSFSFIKNPINLSLLILLGSYLLSTFFSIDVHTSIWGYYSRFNGGLLSFLSYIGLFYLFLIMIEKREAALLLRVILLSAFFVSLYGIYQRLGFDNDRWVQDVQSRVFSTLGQPNWLAAFLASLLPLSFGLYFSRNNYLHFSIYIILIITLFSSLLFTFSLSAFLAFIIVMGVFFILLFRVKPKVDKYYYFSLLLIPLIFILMGKPLWIRVYNQVGFFSPSAPVSSQASQTTLTPVAGSEDSGKIRTIVWKGALEIAKRHEPFGTGVETFAYAYYLYRPVEQNLTTEWDFLYNKAHNEYLNYLSTMGVVGLGSYLFFIGTFLVYGFRTLWRQNDLVLSGIYLGWCSILFTNFFGFSVVSVNVIFYLFPAFFVVLASQKKLDLTTVRVTLFSDLIFRIFSIIVISFIYLWTLSSVISYWMGDINFARGYKELNRGNYNVSYLYLKKALTLRPEEPFYLSEYGYSAASLAALYKTQGAETMVDSLMQQSVSATEKALAISPAHVNYWKTASKTYMRLGTIDPTYNKKSFDALVRAYQLAPTDPKLHYQLALVFFENDKLEEAIPLFEETILLKRDYREVYLDLTDAYIKKGEPEKARITLQNALSLFPNDIEFSKKLKSI